MTTEVDFVLNRVASLLQDTAHVRWTAQSLTDYLNEAQLAVVKKVPSANTTISDLTLVEGTQQNLPADGMTLLDVTRNKPGGSPGAVIRWVDMDIQDATDPDWHTATAAVTVDEYMYDPQDPYVFWVSPPQTGTPTDVELKYSAIPTVVNIGDNIILRDEYVNALVEYMLHRAYSRDAEYAGEDGRAMTHLNQFYKELSAK